MIKPNKFVCNQFKDNRGNLVEIVPKKIKKKFLYSILTESKKNVVRGMHFNKKMNEEKLVFILEALLEILGLFYYFGTRATNIA